MEKFKSRGDAGNQGVPTDNSHKLLRQKLIGLYKNHPMVEEQLLTNLGLYMRSSVLASILLRVEAYKKIISIPGDVMVFGLWWGQDVVLFENTRAIFEPYNTNRNIIGFDTFEGYPNAGIGENDKRSDIIQEGVYAVPEGYENYLRDLIGYHVTENSEFHPNKVEIIKGDVIETAPKYFNQHPEQITALAYFDMALYEPTKVCLEYVLKTCVKGSVIVLDEFNREEYPGETLALKEILQINQVRVERSIFLPDRTFLIIE